MKKLAVNTRLLLKGKLEGLGVYKHEILKRLVARHPEVEFHFIFDRPFDPEFIYGANVVPHVLSPQARHPYLFVAWFDYRIPSLLKKIQPDLFFSPDGYLSLRTSIPQVPVLHDINFVHFPGYFSKSVRWHYSTYFPQYAQMAKKIITISEFCRQDIIQAYGIDPAKTEVVYNGVDQSVPVYTPQELTQIRNKYTSGYSYMISVGALYPRKNLDKQLLAFDDMKQKTGSDLRYLIVGRSYPESKYVYDTLDSLLHKKDVLILGRIDPREELDKLMAGALFNSYVSHFEGFGLPLLESMRLGVPVITSTTSALPEVAGNAGILVNPTDVQDISHAYRRLLYDEKERGELAKSGYERMKQFNWDEAADKVWDILVRSC